MKKFLALFFLVFAFNFHLKADAETLLVPDATVTFDLYQTKCQETGYICTSKYFYDSIVQKPTPQFTEFIDSIDLSNKAFVDGASKKILRILQAEMISPLQLDMLLRLLVQINTNETNSKNKELITELQFILSTFNSSNKTVPLDPEFIVFFKTPLSKVQFEKIKSSYLKLPYAEIFFNHDIKYAVTNSNVPTADHNLVEGTCERSHLTSEVEVVSWKVLSNESCGWSQTLKQASTSTYSTLKENKGWVLVGGLVLGAILISNQYEVHFQF